MRHPRLTAAIFAATTTFVLAGCSSSDEWTVAGHSSFGHVHGIGLNPGDGLVYVAGHRGVFRLDEGAATLLADRAQDTMGFTIAGPDEFLASGHPAIESGDPDPLGLVESTDRADTWTALSLAGEADLHAIDTAGGTIYAYASAGEILVSDDGGKSWSSLLRGTFIDIAADPTNSERLMATTETGTLVSIPRGGKAVAVTDAPRMVLIDRAADGAIVGVGPTGAVVISTDEGASWERTTSLDGRPEALSVRADVWLAATERGLFQSTDLGATWSPLEVTGP